MEFLLNHPITPLILTLGLFAGFTQLADKTGRTLLFNPAPWTILICIAVILLTPMNFEVYKDGTALIHFLLGPVTVALAVPLYKQLPLIQKNAFAILLAVFVGCVVAAFSAWLLAYIMQASEDIQLSILSKSVTVPIAIGVAEKIGAIESLAILFVYTTGIPGAMLALWMFKKLKMNNEAAIGLAMGVTSHGFGTAFAFEKNEQAGTFAALGMSLMGIVSGIAIPIAVYLFLK